VHRYLFVALLAAACGGGEPATPKWQVLKSGNAASFMGVWGSSASDVWAVGGDARSTGGDGLGPIVEHYDGTAWTRLDTGQRGLDLWWVFGIAGGPVFFGGSNGTVLRFANGTFEVIPTPVVSLIFGIWASSPTDVWAVGGQFSANGFVLHYDGNAAGFTAVPVPTELSTNAVWKVSGVASNDVWFSCSFGAVLHWDGQNLVREDVGGAEDLLFSIGATADTVVAVGSNQVNGRLYERVDGAWSDKTLKPTDAPWRGVSVTDAGVFAVGEDATVAQRTDDGWKAELAEGTFENFHADFVDPDGGVWAVGGQFDRIPPIEGVIMYRGTATIAPIP